MIRRVASSVEAVPAAGPVVGDVIATGSFEIDRDALVRYAGASKDFNPIHYRDDVAASVGLPGVLAHGMLTMGVAVQPVVDWLAGAGLVTEYGVRFTRPVVVPPQGAARLDVEAKVAQWDAAARTGRVDLTVRAGADTVLGRVQVHVALHAA